jgi:hypothetical protein
VIAAEQVIVKLVDIGVLEDDYSSEWASSFPSFAISKKNGRISIRTNRIPGILDHQTRYSTYM